jgi:O-antigen ligase
VSGIERRTGDRVLEAILLVAVLTIPWVPVLPAALLGLPVADYDLSKWAVIRLLGAATGLVLAARLFAGRVAPRAPRPPDAAMLLLLVWVGLHFLLSVTVSDNRGVSLRRSLDVLPLALLALGAMRVAAAPGEASRRLLKALVVSTSLVALYGVLQWQGIDFPGITGGEARKAVSAVGNTNTAGAFLVPAIPIALAALLGWSGRRVILATALLTSLLLLHLVATGCRGAFLASTAGLLTTLMVLRGRLDRSRLAVAIGALLLVLAVTAVAGERREEGGELSTLFRRVTSIPSAAHATNRVRLAILVDTLQLVKERPLTGHGPGQFRMLHPRVRSGEEARLSGYDREVRTAHDEPVELLVEGGLLLLLPCLALLVLALTAAYREKDSLHSAALLGALVGIAVVSLFQSVLRNPALALVASILVGMALGTRARTRLLVAPSPPASPVAPALLAALLATLALLPAPFAVRSLAADLETCRGLFARGRAVEHLSSPVKKARGRDLLVEAREHFERAANLLPDDLDARRRLARHLRDSGRMEKDEALLDRAVTELREVLAIFPDDRDIRLSLSLVLLRKGRQDEAKAELETLSTRTPWDPRAPENMALLAVDRGDLEEARRQYARMVALDPSYARDRHLSLQSVPGREKASILLFQAMVEDGVEGIDVPRQQ